MFTALGILRDLAPSVPTPTPGRIDIDLETLGPPPIMYGSGRKPVIGIPTTTGSQIEVLPAGSSPRTAADLKALIAQNGGALMVWTSDVNKSAELQIVKANPLSFKVTAIANDPGMYKITLAEGSGLTGYVPYIVIGIGGILLLSILKK
jgi:hypothetical protein